MFTLFKKWKIKRDNKKMIKHILVTIDQIKKEMSI